MLIGFWSLLGLISTTQVYYLYQSWNPVPFTRVLLWQCLDWYFWVPATPLILWLGGKFTLERRNLIRAIPIHLASAVMLSVAHLAASTMTGRLVDAPRYSEKPFTDILQTLLLKYLQLDLVTYFGILAAGFAFDYYRRYREGQLIASQLETKLAKAQLEALKMQLHPHFLFNTLHAVGVLVRKRETKGALRMLTGLSSLLRVTLDSAGKQLVPLRQELDFLKRYLKIEQIRFRERLEVKMHIDDNVLNARVPNLALQPLVENAIRHGIAPRPDGGTIDIIARRVGAGLRMEVRDNGVGLAEDSAEFSGVGLGNVRARLEQLYGPQHRFEIADHEGGGVAAIVEIPLVFEDNADSDE